MANSLRRSSVVLLMAVVGGHIFFLLYFDQLPPAVMGVLALVLFMATLLVVINGVRSIVSRATHKNNHEHTSIDSDTPNRDE